MINKKMVVIVSFLIVFLLLTSTVQGKNIKFTSDQEIVTDEDSACFALLHGRVGKSHSYAWESFPFALVDAEIKQTRTGILGLYRMILPLGTYNVTAYYEGYEPLTKQITLTKEFSERELNFDFIESTPIKNKNIVKVKSETNEDSGIFGFIHGCVGNSHGVYSWTPCPFALVTAGINRARCGLYGYYSMRLLLYRGYYVTAHVKGFKPLTKYVYLTVEEPIVKLVFDMDESQPANIESKESPKPISYGIIFGFTGGVFEYASWRVGFVKLKFENRTKISGFFGFYIIGYLEISKTYFITSSKEGYIDLTREIKLIKEKPIQMISFYMHQDF
jgi:hypothetical protein